MILTLKVEKKKIKMKTQPPGWHNNLLIKGKIKISVLITTGRKRKENNIPDFMYKSYTNSMKIINSIDMFAFYVRLNNFFLPAVKENLQSLNLIVY